MTLRLIRAILRVISQSRFHVAVPIAKDPEKVCVILGNGPSLTDDINGYFAQISELDLFCVGRFAEPVEYTKLKPKYYVIGDPMFWSSNAPDVTKISRNNLFSAILERTNWCMIVFAPVQAEKEFILIFDHHPYIKLNFFNSTPINGDVWLSRCFYDSNLGMPQVQNVLVACIFLALRMGHKNIALLGADHSWHETLELDVENRVCLRDLHFYDSNAGLKPFTMDGSPDKIFRMDTLFYALAKMFESYWTLAAYAQSLGAAVHNATSLTYIDAFPRRSIDEILNSTRLQ